MVKKLGGADQSDTEDSREEGHFDSGSGSVDGGDQQIAD
jgi:hypothetical protein